MRRKVRIIFTLLSLISCLAFVFLWVHSNRRWEAIDWSRDGRILQIRSAEGILCIQREQHYAFMMLNYTHIWHEAPPEPFDWSKSKIPYTDVIGIITPEMSFWDRFWWKPTPIFRWGGFAIYKS